MDVAQLVRVSDCGPEGRGFDPHHPPSFFGETLFGASLFFVLILTEVQNLIFGRICLFTIDKIVLV